MSETPETPKATAKADAKADAKAEAKAEAKPAAKPAPKPKLEDKPFQAFIKDDLIPSLSQALSSKHQITASIDLIEGDRPVVGGQCWMVTGALPGDRRFWVCFESDSITSGKTIALAESGTEPSLLESFLIDEKRINLPLLQSRLLQRLNGQKWLGGN